MELDSCCKYPRNIDTCRNLYKFIFVSGFSMMEEELYRNKEELTVTSRKLLSVKEKLPRTVAEKDENISKLQHELTTLRSRPQSPGYKEYEARVKPLEIKLSFNRLAF